MSVHPQIAEALKALEEAQIPAIESLSPQEARAQMDAMVRARGGEPRPVGRVENGKVAGPGGEIAVRITWPEADVPLGAVLYFHGGGHVIGNLDTHDRIARNLTAGAEAVVVSVDYRMGPENKFPAAVEDAWAALCWLADNAGELSADSNRLAVAGDSAGANLAAVISLMARDAGGPTLRLQSLVYPVADYGLVDASYRRYGSGYGVLTAAAMKWFRSHYLNDPTEADDWRASPIKANRFDGVAPAVIIAAECDVLHDEGARYAEVLRQAGVGVDYQRYEGMIHGFFGMAPDVDAAVAAQDYVSRALRSALA